MSKKLGIKEAFIIGAKGFVVSIIAGLSTVLGRVIAAGLTDRPMLQLITHIATILVTLTVWGYGANMIFKWK